ncbi:hypothetical protein NQ315_010859 [Exocentrus adspersus]|uniref:Transposase n=1 Tax=Exocentrus adspersus TaxID=1586481 RepID=A0AAV8VBT4_9CUCU|nr:hypothetical protein NQ315_010859 [Exocentrus adspersus]
MVNLTEQERISLLMMRGWGDRERSYEEIVHLFNDTFRVGQTQIHKSTVSRTINRFLETSTNKDRLKSGRPKTQTTEERQGEVAQSFIENHEASFQLNGNVNRHNFRYWSDENPHWMLEKHTQHPQKLNVWAGLFGDQIIGPFFINGTLDDSKSKHSLECILFTGPQTTLETESQNGNNQGETAT